MEFFKHKALYKGGASNAQSTSSSAYSSSSFYVSAMVAAGKSFALGTMEGKIHLVSSSPPYARERVIETKHPTIKALYHLPAWETLVSLEIMEEDVKRAFVCLYHLASPSKRAYLGTLPVENPSLLSACLHSGRIAVFSEDEGFVSLWQLSQERNAKRRPFLPTRVFNLEPAPSSGLPTIGRPSSPPPSTPTATLVHLAIDGMYIAYATEEGEARAMRIAMRTTYEGSGASSHYQQQRGRVAWGGGSAGRAGGCMEFVFDREGHLVQPTTAAAAVRRPTLNPSKSAWITRTAYSTASNGEQHRARINSSYFDEPSPDEDILFAKGGGTSISSNSSTLLSDNTTPVGMEGGREGARRGESSNANEEKFYDSGVPDDGRQGGEHYGSPSSSPPPAFSYSYDISTSLLHSAGKSDIVLSVALVRAGGELSSSGSSSNNNPAAAAAAISGSGAEAGAYNDDGQGGGVRGMAKDGEEQGEMMFLVTTWTSAYLYDLEAGAVVARYAFGRKVQKTVVSLPFLYALTADGGLQVHAMWRPHRLTMLLSTPLLLFSSSLSPPQPRRQKQKSEWKLKGEGSSSSSYSYSSSKQQRYLAHEIAVVGDTVCLATGGDDEVMAQLPPSDFEVRVAYQTSNGGGGEKKIKKRGAVGFSGGGASAFSSYSSSSSSSSSSSAAAASYDHPAAGVWFLGQRDVATVCDSITKIALALSEREREGGVEKGGGGGGGGGGGSRTFGRRRMELLIQAHYILELTLARRQQNRMLAAATASSSSARPRRRHSQFTNETTTTTTTTTTSSSRQGLPHQGGEGDNVLPPPHHHHQPNGGSKFLEYEGGGHGNDDDDQNDDDDGKEAAGAGGDDPDFEVRKLLGASFGYLGVDMFSNNPSVAVDLLARSSISPSEVISFLLRAAAGVARVEAAAVRQGQMSVLNRYITQLLLHPRPHTQAAILRSRELTRRIIDQILLHMPSMLGRAVSSTFLMWAPFDRKKVAAALEKQLEGVGGRGDQQEEGRGGGEDEKKKAAEDDDDDDDDDDDEKGARRPSRSSSSSSSLTSSIVANSNRLALAVLYVWRNEFVKAKECLDGIVATRKRSKVGGGGGLAASKNHRKTAAQEKPRHAATGGRNAGRKRSGRGYSARHSSSSSSRNRT
eukprot:jgi/Bigna1/77866/fgenesh1_pg.51_\